MSVSVLELHCFSLTACRAHGICEMHGLFHLASCAVMIELRVKTPLSEREGPAVAVSFDSDSGSSATQVTAYRAGHVLGAAMFMVEIAGLRVLYTGDYSRLADRHLSAADLPELKPDVGE